ncbi:MAG TPA: hypothetical protein PLJ34_08330 [Hyphomicrobiales bacterium]|nr:hypothetical protein [Kaistiaceae bacterium]HQF31440.1 hypothetical protein [Hyphomicrobiales bacterium]
MAKTGKFVLRTTVIFPDDVVRVARQAVGSRGETVRLPADYGEHLIVERLAEAVVTRSEPVEEKAVDVALVASPPETSLPLGDQPSEGSS